MNRATSILIGLLLVCAPMLAGCTVSRANVDTLQPRNAFSGGLPMNATLLVRVPLLEQQARINVQDGYGNIHVLNVGADLREASLAVPRKYFRDVVPFTPEAKGQYILSAVGGATLSTRNGDYTAKLDAGLFGTDGRLIYKAHAEGVARSGRINDANAFFNAYVDALQSFLDDAFNTAGAAMQTDAGRRAPTPTDFSRTAQQRASMATNVGSGFYVSHRGIIATARSSIDECLGIQVQQPDGTQQARVLATDTSAGIALLQVAQAAQHVSVLTSADATAQPGQQVVTFMYPRLTAVAQSPTLMMGTVRASAGSAADANRNELQVSLPDGARGGPVLDMFGRVIGVLKNGDDVARESSPAGKPEQNLHFFAGSSALRSLLEANNIDYTPAPSPTAPAPMSDIAANANRTLVQIVCTE